jgi:hypothetical protein
MSRWPIDRMKNTVLRFGVVDEGIILRTMEELISSGVFLIARGMSA